MTSYKVIQDTCNGKSIKYNHSLLVWDGYHRLSGDGGPKDLQWESALCFQERLLFNPLEGENMLSSPLRTSFGWGCWLGHSIALSDFNAFCFGIASDLPSRKIQVCGYPYVWVIIDSTRVSLSALFSNTSFYETVILIVGNLAGFFKTVFYMPVSWRF